MRNTSRQSVRWVGLGWIALLWGCGDDDVAAQREKWREQRPEQYVIQTCGTGFMQPGCSVQAIDGDSDSDPVERMFDTVETSDCDVETLTFDPTYGFITEYYLDCGEEGWGLVVECFQADTVNTSGCD